MSHHRLEGSPGGSPASEVSLKLPRLIFKLRGAPGPGAEQGAGYTPASQPQVPSGATLVGQPPPRLPHPSSSSLTGEGSDATQPAQPVIVSV